MTKTPCLTCDHYTYSPHLRCAINPGRNAEEECIHWIESNYLSMFKAGPVEVHPVVRDQIEVLAAWRAPNWHERVKEVGVVIHWIPVHCTDIAYSRCPQETEAPPWAPVKERFREVILLGFNPYNKKLAGMLGLMKAAPFGVLVEEKTGPKRAYPLVCWDDDGGYFEALKPPGWDQPFKFVEF